MNDPATGESSEGSWRDLSNALAHVATTWHQTGAAQAQGESEGNSGIRQLGSEEMHDLARAGYEAAEVLAGIATVLAGQRDSEATWQSAQSAQREAWRHWRVAMDALSPGESTP